MLATKTRPDLAAKLDVSAEPRSAGGRKRGTTMVEILAMLTPLHGCGTPGLDAAAARMSWATATIHTVYPAPSRTAAADLRPSAFTG